MGPALPRWAYELRVYEQARDAYAYLPTRCNSTMLSRKPLSTPSSFPPIRAAPICLLLKKAPDRAHGAERHNGTPG